MKGKKEASKKQKMTKECKTGFMIWDFMIDRLCLTGVPLMVFALIYSFTIAESNCYGSIEYIATRVGASCSSVKRALNVLLLKNLIIKRSDKSMRTKIYTANLPMLIGKDPMLSQIDPPGTDRLADSNMAFEEPDLGYNNKEIIKSTTPSSSADAGQKDEIPVFLTFGAEGLVMMTMEQYLDLKKRIGEEVLIYYINRLEGSLIMKPGMYLKNHYKTILKWVREDSAVLE